MKVGENEGREVGWGVAIVGGKVGGNVLPTNGFPVGINEGDMEGNEEGN